ncbi:MAG: helix-turn-helix domain-containing protein [Lachnospiraceae bacterium]|nr:helix-turn-helix domain-containing protein [Lachnospiraceae bacterium]
MGENMSPESGITMLTAKELSSVLRIGRDKAYALMKSNGFPSICIGKRYFVTTKALNDWINQYEYKQFAV